MKHFVYALTLILLAAAPLSAQRDENKRPNKRDAMEKLNLSDEQKDALQDIRTASKKDMIDIRADIKKKRIEVQEITRADKPDRPEFERVSRELADLQIRQKLLLFDSQQKMLQQLNEEQQEIFKKMQKHRKMAMRDGKPGRGRRPHDAEGR